MVRRKKEKKKPAALGIPKGIVLLATPEAWRFSVLTLEGGVLCGRLDVAINTNPEDARAAAAAMVTGLARDFHDTDVEVHWDPPPEPWSWTAQVTLTSDSERWSRRTCAQPASASRVSDGHPPGDLRSWPSPEETA
ncbi:hypothetical protein [Streptomyces sp. AP-93]|uniref:hypothetical protein n=1 Tax=Streptomyces sp. AP-93 TaxID=2929048 RepID=UPI001FAEC4EF|nr:hypothetical protein [Streptomyces sp. AP-93]MCJ0874965.1 hypothetical protein [Streptomyces sp. AP-93]